MTLQATGSSKQRQIWFNDVTVLVKPLKNILLQNDGGVWGNDPDSDEDTIVLRSTEQTVSGEWNIENPARRKLSLTEVKKAVLKSGDLLLTKSSGSESHIGKTSLVNEHVENLRACYSNFMQRLRLVEGVNPKYVYYFLNNELARQQFDYLSNTTTGLSNLNAEIIGSIQIPVPDDKTQNLIVAYLDKQTAKIDSLIKEKQSFIILLKEKRQALISHYVTNSSSRQVRLKFYIDGISSGTSVNAADVPAEPHQHGVLKTSCVYTGEFDYTKNKTVIDEEVLRVSCPLLKDTLIVSRMNTPDLVGAAGLVTESVSNIYLPDRLWQVSFKDGLNPKFAYYWTLSNSYREQVKLACAGTSASMQNLSQDEFQNFLIPQIDESIQHKIVSELDSKLSTLGQLMHETSLSIELLKEHRTALISAAVTGKIDVRDMANNKDAS